MDPINFIPRVTGSISATASSLIIYLIFRSEKKLSSIYHRIIFGMSSADILTSLAIVLTTLPIPSDLPCEDNPWEGRAKGNIQTCEAQGFIIITGVFVIGLYNAMLCVYYACVIAFQMSEDKIHKRVEPFLLSIPVIVGIAGGIHPLLFHNINPNKNWCGLSMIQCTVQDESGSQSQYVRGSKEALKISNIYRVVVVGSIGVVIVTSLMLTVHRVWIIDEGVSDHENRISNVTLARIRDQTQTESDGRPSGEAVGNEVLDEVRREKKTTKIITVQALAYTIAYILTLLLPLFSLKQDNPLTNAIITAIFPLQGFLNFIIFLSHKVYNHRRRHLDEGYCLIISKFFCGPTVEEPGILSRMSLVQLDDEMWNQRVEDEDGHENVSADLSTEGHEDGRLETIDVTGDGRLETIDITGDGRLETTDSFNDDADISFSITGERMMASRTSSSSYSFFGISDQSTRNDS